jgi:hypothetical protein
MWCREDLWDLVTPPIPPISTSKGETKSKSEGKRLVEEAPTVAKLEQKRRHRDCVMAFLRLVVTEEIRPRIEDMDDPAVAWTYLIHAFQTNTIADTMVVLNQWESLHMQDNQDVSTFISLVHRILRELNNIG